MQLSLFAPIAPLLLALLSAASPTRRTTATANHRVSRAPHLLARATTPEADWPSPTGGPGSVVYSEARWPTNVRPEDAHDIVHLTTGEIPRFIASTAPLGERPRASGVVVLYIVVKETRLPAEPGQIVHTFGLMLQKYQREDEGWQSVGAGKLYEDLWYKAETAKIVAWGKIGLADPSSWEDLERVLVGLETGSYGPAPSSAAELQLSKLAWIGWTLMELRRSELAFQID
ncbi:MAG: hypothetical protein M1829_002766 [Trizodia sp. TS-e1964]|nr:MAG: hypothetical protein M1829_002766 [Trizodia sp. TS-e1964]